jgi:putative ABC transport system substrate-binding protein
MRRVEVVLALLLVVLASLGPVSGRSLKIGICQIVEHPALNAARQGVIDSLAASGYVEGRDVEYLIADAQGDPNNAVPIAQNFRSQGVDLVVAISTPMALAAAEVFRESDTPIVFSAVTDPVACGLVVDAADPSKNGNITGVSDLIDVATDLQLLKELSPSIVRIGMVYNPGEANSDLLTRRALEIAPSLGLKIVTAVADSTANVPLAAQSLVGRVDAFYVTTDNTVVSAIDAVVTAAEEARVPFLMADPTSLKFGPTIATGFDYYQHGLITGGVVAEVLAGKRPNEIPVAYQTGAKVYLNLDAAAKIGLTFPQSLIDKASGIYYGGTLWERAGTD